MTPVTDVDGHSFRAWLGRFSTGITILTIATDSGVHGMTANAFTAVSLHPPLVLVCVANRARMRSHLDTGASLGISILAAEQKEMSAQFAGARTASCAVTFEWDLGVPLIGGALAHLACRVENRHEAGDHTMYVCRVAKGRFREGEPLIFFQGGYHRLRSNVARGVSP